MKEKTFSLKPVMFKSMMFKTKEAMQMSQQHTQFEEKFRDGPQPTPSYEGGYSGPQPVSYTAPVPPPLQSYGHVPGQKLLIQDVHSGKAPSPGQRLALAIVSLGFVFLLFIVTIGIAAAAPQAYFFPVIPIAFVFSLVFAVVALILNLIFNRGH
jgi:hypothetical protein